MALDVNQFLSCPHCGAIKELENWARITDQNSAVRIIYECATEVVIQWDGKEATSQWTVRCMIT